MRGGRSCGSKRLDNCELTLLALQTQILNGHRAGWDYFKDNLPVYSYGVCSVMALDM